MLLFIHVLIIYQLLTLPERNNNVVNLFDRMLLWKMTVPGRLKLYRPLQRSVDTFWTLVSSLLY